MNIGKEIIIVIKVFSGLILCFLYSLVIFCCCLVFICLLFLKFVYLVFIFVFLDFSFFCLDWLIVCLNVIVNIVLCKIIVSINIIIIVFYLFKCDRLVDK